MSRTYRTVMLVLDDDHKPFDTEQKKRYFFYNICRGGRSFFCDYYSKRNLKRDGKTWIKPNKEYKKITKRHRKAKERSSMQKKDYDNIPLFRKEDQRDWL